MKKARTKGADEPYRLLVEQTGEGAFTLNAEGVVVYANRALARLLGRPPGEVTGARLAGFLGAAGRERLAALLRLADAEGMADAEIALPIRTGRAVVLRLGASRLPPEGEAAYCLIASDVTALHAREAELRRLRDGLEERVKARTAELAERNRALEIANEELEAFAYSVAHDLSTPLRAIDGFSLTLMEDYAGKLGAEGREGLQRVRAASQRMGRLIDDILRLSRVTRAEIKVAEMDFSAAAREIAASLQQAEPTRLVRWQIDEGVRLRGDPALVGIALDNLVRNAWKFTTRTARPLIRVGAHANGSGKEYFVADNGVGFDMAEAGRLFRAFHRLHAGDDYPGTGIGLAIVERIVRRHGGTIRAEARPGEGAAFSFTLGPSGPAGGAVRA